MTLEIIAPDAATDTARALPPGWTWAKLGDVCQQDRSTIDGGSDFAAKLPYLSLEHVESQTGRILKEPSDPIDEEGKSNTFAFDKRHVLYGKLRPYLNKVALPDFAGRCTTELIPILPLASTERVYLAWLLRRQETVDAVMREKTGSRMPRADMDELLAVEVPLAPLPEQQRIAAILADRLATHERALAALDAQIAAATDLPAAYLRAIFDSDAAKTWPKKRLGDITTTGSGATPSRNNPEYYQGTFPWVKTGELQDNIIYGTEEHVSEAALRETSLKRLPINSLLVAMYGQGQTRGRTGLLAVEATTNQACFAILPNPKTFEPSFLQWWFRHNYHRLRDQTEGRGGNQPNLNGELLKAECIGLPPLAEQKRIAAELAGQMADVARLRAGLLEQCKELVAYPATLLRQAFAGELTAEIAPTISNIVPFDKKERGALLATYVRHSVKKENPLNRVKMEKSRYFAETVVGFELGATYKRDAAGPNEGRFLIEVEEYAHAQRWFDTEEQVSPHKFVYHLAEKSDEAVARAIAMLGEYKSAMDKMLDLLAPFPAPRVSRIASLFAAWNDFLLDGRQPTDEEIIREVRENWHPKKERLGSIVLQETLVWMRQNNFVPRGIGTHTRVKSAESGSTQGQDA